MIKQFFKAMHFSLSKMNISNDNFKYLIERKSQNYYFIIYYT